MFRFDYPGWLDPVIFSIGPIQLTWYALAYMIGLIAGWQIIRWRAGRDNFGLSPQDIDDFMIYALLGVIIGGRVGTFIFGWGGTEGILDTLKTIFWPVQETANGGWRLAIAGMSFHGGFLGVVCATILFWLRKKRSFNLWQFSDYVALVAPIGLFLGRMANFINMELNGRVAGDKAFISLIYKTPETANRNEIRYADSNLEACAVSGNSPARCSELYDLSLPRHPSQIYEALGEGLLLLAVLTILFRIPWVRQRFGLMTGVFIAGYGLVRFFIEYVREFTDGVGLSALGLSRSQELSVPMILVGLGLIVWAIYRHRRA